MRFLLSLACLSRRREEWYHWELNRLFAGAGELLLVGAASSLPVSGWLEVVGGAAGPLLVSLLLTPNANSAGGQEFTAQRPLLAEEANELPLSSYTIQIYALSPLPQKIEVL